MRRSAPASHNRRVSGGFPHSDIPGSKGALASPGLIAECHVLHRLLLPRHPPNALIALDPIQKTTGPFARGWFGLNPSSRPGRKSLTHRRSLGRGDAAVASPERSLQIRQDPRSVSFDLERLLSLQRTSKGPLRGARPTRRTPEQRLVYCSLHDVSVPDVAIRRSVSRRLARAIGQEGSSQMNLPIRSGASRILRLCRKRRWWSLSPRRGANQRLGRRNQPKVGGAYRDRTGDLMLAKHALSQLS